MRIVNRSSGVVDVEIKAGPVRMTMSTCELEPGEEESWRSPYRGVRTECEVHVTRGDTRWRATADASATVYVDDDGLTVAP